MKDRAPLIVGIGGSLKEGSSSGFALSVALQEAGRLGATTVQFSGASLDLPLYDQSKPMSLGAERLVSAVARADGLIISSPCYHGGVAGLVKNALDYLEELRTLPRIYLDGIAVGCIGCGLGWQGPSSVLSALRNTVHSLRGWPTPLGVAVNTEVVRFGDGVCSDPAVTQRLAVMAGQVVDFALASDGHRAA
jgi:FMN reductase